MNALELADKLDNADYDSYYLYDLASTMLRQQQAEIETLKAQLAKYGTNGQAIPCLYNPYEVPWGVIETERQPIK